MTRITRALARLPLFARVALAVLVTFAVTYLVPDTAHASTIIHGHTVPLLMGMIIVPWQPPLSRDELDAIANPMFANQPEVVPWQLYDTQNFTTGVTTSAVFFQSINVDKTLSNMEGPGQLPEPQYFVCHYIACDFLIAAQSTAITATANNAALDDIENVLKVQRATVEFNMSNKRYGPFSLTMTAATGGATGSLYGVGTLAAAVAGGVVNNGIPGTGGFPFGGALVIPPKIGFDVTVRLAAPATLPVSPLPLRISLVGALYRRVL